MKTTAWSFVLLAGTAVAAPGYGGPHGGDNTESWGTDDSSSWGSETASWGEGRPTESWGSESTTCTEEEGHSKTWSPVTTSAWSSESSSSVWSSSAVSSSTPSSSVVSTSPVTTSAVSSSTESTSAITSSTSSSTWVRSHSTPSSSVVSSSTPSSSAQSTSSPSSSALSSSTPHSTGVSSSSTPYSSAVSSSTSSATTWVNTWSTPVHSSSTPVSSGLSSSSTPHSTGVQSSSTPHSSGVSSSSTPYSSAVSSSTSSATTWVNTWSTPVHSTGVSSSTPVSSGVSSSSTPYSSGVLSSTSSATWVNTWSTPVHSTGVSSSTPVSSGVSKKSSSTPSVGPVTSSTTSASQWHGTWTETSFSFAPTTTSEYTTWLTEVTTEYTTVCPVTATWTSNKAPGTVSAVGSGSSVAPYSSGVSTGTWTYLSTSTLTSVYTSTVTAPITVTEITTEYTTICPATQTTSSGQSTWTSTYQTTSTVTTVYKSTVTLSPSSPASSPVSPVGGPSTVTVTPVPATSSPTWAANSSPAQSGVTVTEITTEYTTVCPATQTTSNGQSTWTTTYQTTSTVTTSYLSTITVSTEAPWSVVPWGESTFTYSLTQPVVYPSTTLTGNWGGNGGWSNGTGSVGPTGSAVSSGRKPRSTGVTGSVSKPASGTSRPSGTGSKSAPSGSAPSTGPTSSATSSSTSSTCSRPTGSPQANCTPCEGNPGSDPSTYCGLTVNDDSYKNTPKTCNFVEYDFTITNTTVSPDGVERIGLLINGQFPGPKIEANWGDVISVTVHNQLTDNGTSIHFHGTRQYYTNEMDGVSSITQCPLAPGSSQTYTFVASNYGSSWYHSHFGMQIYDGIFGPMVIHGPASADYDEEDFIVIQDWNHVSVNELYDTSQDLNAPGSGPQNMDTGLINGLNVFGADGSSSQTGKRYVLNVESGKSYRLRLLNAAVQSTFKFYIDGHSFQVIAADYVPIKPYTTNILNINCGQRYDIVFKADQPVGNYWLRADGQNSCTTIINALDIKAIVSYAGAPSGLPTSTAYTYTTECVDEPLASLVPVVTVSAGNQDETITENILIGGNGGTPNLYKWTLSGTTFVSQWDSPTLGGIVANGSVPDWSGNLAITVPNLGEWVYIIIESPIPVPHPIHLHGHDFLILAQGYGSYSSSVALNTANPPRRDTALMPSNQGQSGYLVIAFETDNPGAWLLHCHIGWHSAMGLALQIIENLEGINDSLTDSCGLGDLCDAWSSWTESSGYDRTVIDAGI